MQNVTHWFLVGYILGCRWWYMRVVRVVSLVGCKDYLSSHELSSLTYITPNESWNALCSLYAGGLLWARNYAQKGSVNSVGSVRERTPQELSSALSLTVGAFYFSQIYTEEQNTQHSKQVVAPPPSPPPKGGAWSPRYPYKKDVGLMLSLNPIYNGYNVLWTLYAGGLLCARNSAQKILLNLCALWEKKIPNVREKTPQPSCLCVIS